LQAAKLNVLQFEGGNKQLLWTANKNSEFFIIFFFGTFALLCFVLFWVFGDTGV
jgi:hypothetical protein